MFPYLVLELQNISICLELSGKSLCSDVISLDIISNLRSPIMIGSTL